MKIDISRLSQADSFVRLSKAHDVLKEHPYRNNFSPMWECSYNECLCDLSNAWAAFIYHSQVSEDERDLLKKFGGWIHNYNASLLFPKINQELIPYYESVIAMTHRFLKTGTLHVYYQLEGRTGSYAMLKYYLVTEELCEIDSPQLPMYLPQSQLLCEDEGKIRDRIVKYNVRHKSDAEIDAQVSRWSAEVLPIIRWHNDNLRNSRIAVFDESTGSVVHLPIMKSENIEEAPVYKSM